MPLSSLQLLALLNVPRIGKKTALKLSLNFEKVPSEDEFVEKLSNKDSGVKPQILKEILLASLTHAKTVFEKSESLGIKWVNIFEDNYPTSLRNAVSENGKNSIAPPIIFYKGNIKLLNGSCLLIIGSRNCGESARKAALYLSDKFAARGFSIVSGLAIGCDAAAHSGAIRQGKTIAVVGNGLDIVYPKEHKELASNILDSGGLIISEYELGTPVSKYTLVERDLLQTAISKAVIVVQSSEKGGSMHAAITACNSDKKLFTVKFSDESVNNSEDCSGNKLLVSKYGASYIEPSPDQTYMNSYLDNISKQIQE